MYMYMYVITIVTLDKNQSLLLSLMSSALVFDITLGACSVCVHTCYTQRILILLRFNTNVLFACKQDIAYMFLY